MSLYQDVESELLEMTPEDPMEYPPPYGPNMNLPEKFNVTIQAVERAKRLQNRILQLVNVYYLGVLLEIEAGPAERDRYAQQLTSHYRITAVRLYYLFELPGVKQLMRSKRITLTTIKRLTSQEFQDLVQRSVEIFSGAEN